MKARLLQPLITVSFSRKMTQGFTLLEVLIAITIFALISLTGFTIFDTVVKSDQSSRLRTERINELQRAFLLMERDFLQIARRSVRINGEAPLAGFLHTDSNSFDLGENTLAFVRQGWTNPGLLLPRSDMQSVAYQLNDNNLERLHYNFVDAVIGEEPKVRKLLSQVDELTFEFYYGKQWLKKINDNATPLAIAVELKTADYGLIRREFLVAGDAN